MGTPQASLSADTYTETLQNRHNRSRGITTDTGSNEYMMESHAEDLFLPDAWLGMKRCATHTTCPAHACACQRAHTQPQQRRCPPRRLVQYGHYVDSLEEQEAAPFCTDCATNRKILEHAWQVVANEFYDPYGRFNQAEWAARLQQTLEQHGGVPPTGFCAAVRAADGLTPAERTAGANGGGARAGTLESKGELYAAARQMIGGLGDQYSAFLEPGAFRAAIRKPTKAELDYMSETAVGAASPRRRDRCRGLAGVLARHHCVCRRGYKARQDRARHGAHGGGNVLGQRGGGGGRAHRRRRLQRRWPARVRPLRPPAQRPHARAHGHHRRLRRRARAPHAGAALAPRSPVPHVPRARHPFVARQQRRLIIYASKRMQPRICAAVRRDCVWYAALSSKAQARPPASAAARRRGARACRTARG